ncbi:PAS domain-containing methyl-accepting chemotaxis protein [Halomonas alkaliantarctica]|uniref:PAS domain-containing methyl-accepting chemotaxis protein n=1 Tax=Halomonas alkaliantarctica TaxID=232346 RepID=A0ABY8LMH9_9GAMM|nr:PAS domain-containing methyl-accepting chemotaxis protein [Halomonas alkaliantarctica]WGI24573.1 PAS domain-containing methyl-accepting chemotaxis protein [Halomonas alkaliantarctica]
MLTLLASNGLHSALYQHTACISFSPEGIIKEASEQFLTTVGYSLEQVKGQHHRIFCFPEESSSLEYRTFWETLAAGHSQQGRFRRSNALGDEIWLEATYLPISNRRGKVVEILKIANDVTTVHQEAERKNAVLEALNSSMAVIEFTPNGEILNANTNFEKVMGYRNEELVGAHHRMFCPADFSKTNPLFWERLAQGEYMQGKFQRLDSRGTSVWLEATYNPIQDGHGKVVKVVKFATDITRSVEAAESATRAVTAAQSTSSQTEQIAQNGLSHLQRVVRDSEQAALTLAEAQQLISALNKQAQSINSITESIALIANQTNLLSLNAAIEAARAGEQGRGFAVVANEVRRLAKGSSEAVDEITKVLKENSALVERTTQAMQQVVEQGKSSQTSVGEIEIIVNEILTGARSVSTSIEQLALEAS